jgi:thymidylate synthase ThyX
MNNIFEVIDKTGRQIRLTKKQFEHVICHKGMENYIEEIKDALENPLRIISHEAGNLFDYFNYYKNRKQKAKYLQVVVKYLNGKGFVLTAYFVRHM